MLKARAHPSQGPKFWLQQLGLHMLYFGLEEAKLLHANK